MPWQMRDLTPAELDKCKDVLEAEEKARKRAASKRKRGSS